MIRPYRPSPSTLNPLPIPQPFLSVARGHRKCSHRAMPTPMLTLVTYQARPGSEEELAGVLRTHVARLRELGLIADKPHFAAARADKQGMFVESFWWAHQGAPALAHEHALLVGARGGEVRLVGDQT